MIGHTVRYNALFSVAVVSCVAVLMLGCTSRGATGPEGQSGVAGAGGQMGTPGQQGPPGPSGASGYVLISQATTFETTIPTVGPFTASCPTGKRAVGGGFVAAPATGMAFPTDLFTYTNGPVSDGGGWQVVFGSGHDGVVALTVTAICATTS
jgi:hypothetical protein